MNASDTSKPSRTDWAKLDKMTGEMIDTSDSPELDEGFFERAELRLPESVSIALEVDPGVLAWFKSQDESLKLMNAALRLYAEVHRKTL